LRIGSGNKVGAGVGDGLGEGVNVSVLVTVGLAVGLGEGVVVWVNAGAAWDWQAARKTSNRIDIRSLKSIDFGLR
jgi:hypothetical protein